MKEIPDGHLASEVFIYVDYGCIIEHSELVCWQAENNFCSICNSLGIQYASRKQKEPSLTPGPWAVTVAHTSINEVVITVTRLNWGKPGVLSQIWIH